jgi:hypothetical protein
MIQVGSHFKADNVGQPSILYTVIITPANYDWSQEFGMYTTGEMLLHQAGSIVQHLVSRLRYYHNCHRRGPTSWIRCTTPRHFWVSDTHDMAQHAFRLRKSDTTSQTATLSRTCLFCEGLTQCTFSERFLTVYKNFAQPAKIIFLCKIVRLLE